MTIVEVNQVYEGKMFAQPNLTLRRTLKSHHNPRLLFESLIMDFGIHEGTKCFSSTYSEIG